MFNVVPLNEAQQYFVLFALGFSFFALALVLVYGFRLLQVAPTDPSWDGRRAEFVGVTRGCRLPAVAAVVCIAAAVVFN
jgi:hypothetical protein